MTVKPVAFQNEVLQNTRIPIALQSNNPPDVFQNWGGGSLVDQVKAGKVQDLTKYVKPWIKSIGGSAAGWQVNGKQYAIPYSVGVVGLLVQQRPLQAGRDHVAAEDVAAVPRRDRQAEGAGVTPIAVGGKDKWPDAFYWDYLAIKLCSKSTMQQSAVSYNFADPCWLRRGSS